MKSIKPSKLIELESIFKECSSESLMVIVNLGMGILWDRISQEKPTCEHNFVYSNEIREMVNRCTKCGMVKE